MKETLKIRHYVMGVLYRSGASSVKIMSARELAAHFGIARSTVSLALKDLIDEGYLIARQGIGNFTSPHRMQAAFSGRSPKLIGIIYGDGRYYYLDRTAWKSFAALGDAAVQHGWNVRQLQLEATTPEEIVEEILLTPVDAILWVDHMVLPLTVAKRLAGSGVPFLCDVNTFLADINTVVFDLERAVRAFAVKMLAENRREILLYLSEWKMQYALPYLQEVFAAAGVTPSITICHTNDEFLTLREKMMQKKWFDVAAVEIESRFDLRQNLPPELCPEFADWWKMDDLNHPNAEPVIFSYRRRAEVMMERLEQLFAGDREIRRVFVPMEEPFASFPIVYTPQKKR